MQNVVKKRNSLLWGVVAIIVGVLVMLNPSDSIHFVIRIVGFGLLVVGIMQLVTFLFTRKRLGLSWWSIPLGGVLSLILGAMLVASPDIFKVFIMYFIGAILIALSAMQIYSLVTIKRTGAKFSGGYFVFPVLLMLSGVVCMIYPDETTAWTIIFAGAWIAAYGVAETVGYFTIKTLEEGQDKYPDMP